MNELDAALTEHQHQVRIKNWFDDELCKLGHDPIYGYLYGRLYGAIGGVYLGKSGGRIMNQLKAQGFRKGWHDLTLLAARGGYFGFTLDVKKLKGKPSKEQIEWADWLAEQGYYAGFGEGWRECTDIIKWYVDLPPTPRMKLEPPTAAGSE